MEGGFFVLYSVPEINSSVHSIASCSLVAGVGGHSKNDGVWPFTESLGK